MLTPIRISDRPIVANVEELVFRNPPIPPRKNPDARRFRVSVTDAGRTGIIWLDFPSEVSGNWEKVSTERNYRNFEIAVSRLIDAEKILNTDSESPRRQLSSRSRFFG